MASGTLGGTLANAKTLGNPSAPSRQSRETIRTRSYTPDSAIDPKKQYTGARMLEILRHIKIL